MRRVLLPALLLAAACAAHAAPGLLVVTGIGGEEHYSQQFRDWSLQMLDAADTHLAIPRERVVWLCESRERDPTRCAGESRRDAVLDAVARLAGGDDDAPLLVLLIGHGTARDGRALFNLPGPDLSADDLAQTLDAFAGRRIAVVNTAPASAPFATRLAGAQRVVITATASEAENDHTTFAGHFVAAFAGGAADADKDGQVSLLEAFHFAAGEVARGYAGKQQLATEHALLEDSGDGQGSREPSLDGRDGSLAAQFILALARGGDSDSPLVRALQREARELVAQVAVLRRQRVALSQPRYEQALEELLLALAMNRRALRAAAR
jgi:hypothetical protein